MRRIPSRERRLLSLVLLVGFGGLFLLTSCGGTSAEDRAAAELKCGQFATARSGYDPARPPVESSSVGKGAAIGAASGAAVGAVTSSKSKKVVQGAAIGAAAGAGAGAIKDNEAKKAAEKAAAAYQSEYAACMREEGF